MRPDSFRLHRAQCGITIEIATGPARGVVATLIVGPDHTNEHVEAAKREVRKKFCVTMLQIRRFR